jgi:TonB family protein
MEEWWASPDQDRREYKMGSYSATEIRTSGNTYRTKGADLPPYYLELLRNQIVHPVQSLPTSKPRFPRLRKAGDSKTPLECIALKWNKDASEQEASNYCFGSKSDDLAILTDYTYQTIAREAIGDFQGRRVSVSTTVSYNRIKAATARIESLASAPIPDAEFEITPDLDLRTPLFVSSGADDALIEPISRPDGDYPDLVQTGDNAVGIMLRCVIGKDGLVRKIEVVGATNPKFVDAAVASLRRWKYEPIVWNGQPAEAEITVVVDIHRD